VFEKLLEELEHEVLVGNATKNRMRACSRQKNDRRGAELILDLMIKNEFPRIYRVPVKSSIALSILTFDLGKGKPRRSAIRSISWSSLLSARDCSVERDEFVDPRLHRFRQQRDFSLTIVCGAEGVADLPLAQPCKPITDPADLRNGNVME